MGLQCMVGVEMTFTLKQGDCLELMKELPDNSIDLIVTSPPYDNLRDYNNSSKYSMNRTLSGMYDKIKLGGVVIWIISDQTIDGSESGSSFRSALYAKEIGFNLHDTMIYLKDMRYPDDIRYSSAFEYMFVFSKGKPKTFNPIKRNPLWRGKNKVVTNRNKDGHMTAARYSSPQMSTGPNVFYYSTGYGKSAKEDYIFEHPAIFPEQLAWDQIYSWSDKDDIILDPFMGSGTTGVAALRLILIISRLQRNV